MGSSQSTGFTGEIIELIISILNNQVSYRAELCELMRNYYEDENSKYTEEECIQFTAEKLIRDLLDNNRYGSIFIPALSKINQNPKYNFDRVAINTCLAKSAIELLTELKTDIALHRKMLECCSRGELDKIKKIQKFIDINWTNKAGESALIIACKYGFIDIANYCIKQRNANINIITADGNNALIYASKAGLTEIVHLLLTDTTNIINVNCINKEGGTALIYASENGHFTIIQYLLESQANPNIVNKQGDNALILAVRNNYISIVKSLIQYGSALDQIGSNGATAVCIAAKFHLFELVEYLIGNGANIDILDSEQKSVCSYENNRGTIAQSIQRGFHAKLKLLLQQESNKHETHNNNHITKSKSNSKKTKKFNKNSSKAYRNRNFKNNKYSNNNNRTNNNNNNNEPINSISSSSTSSSSSVSSDENSSKSSNSETETNNHKNNSKKHHDIKSNGEKISNSNNNNNNNNDKNIGNIDTPPLGSDEEQLLLAETENAMMNKIISNRRNKQNLLLQNGEESDIEKESKKEEIKSNIGNKSSDIISAIIQTKPSPHNHAVLRTTNIIAGEDEEEEESSEQDETDLGTKHNNNSTGIIANNKFAAQPWRSSAQIIQSPSFQANNSNSNEQKLKLNATDYANKKPSKSVENSDSDSDYDASNKTTKNEQIQQTEAIVITMATQSNIVDSSQFTALSMMKSAVTNQVPINPFELIQPAQPTESVNENNTATASNNTTNSPNIKSVSTTDIHIPATSSSPTISPAVYSQTHSKHSNKSISSSNSSLGNSPPIASSTPAGIDPSQLQKKLEAFDVLAWLDSLGFDNQSIAVLNAGGFNFNDLYYLELDDSIELLGEKQGTKLYNAARQLKKILENKEEEKIITDTSNIKSPIHTNNNTNINTGNNSQPKAHPIVKTPSSAPITQSSTKRANRRPVQAVWSKPEYSGLTNNNATNSQSKLSITTENDHETVESKADILVSPTSVKSAGGADKQSAISTEKVDNNSSLTNGGPSVEPKSAPIVSNPINSSPPPSSGSASVNSTSTGSNNNTTSNYMFSPSNWAWPSGLSVSTSLTKLKQSTSQALNTLLESQNTMLNNKRKLRKKRLTERHNISSTTQNNNKINNNNTSNSPILVNSSSNSPPSRNSAIYSASVMPNNQDLP